MKAITSKVTASLQKGSSLVCADNSGAKELQIIAVRGFKGKKRTNPRGGVGSLVVCRVLKGNEKVRHEKFKCVIIRQKKEYRRPDGTRIRFEDNAAVIVDDQFAPKGSIIKGPVAREAVQRFATLSKIASMVA
jgi:large subunit ribosomal protein L14